MEKHHLRFVDCFSCIIRFFLFFSFFFSFFLRFATNFSKGDNDKIDIVPVVSQRVRLLFFFVLSFSHLFLSFLSFTKRTRNTRLDATSRRERREKVSPFILCQWPRLSSVRISRSPRVVAFVFFLLAAFFFIHDRAKRRLERCKPDKNDGIDNTKRETRLPRRMKVSVCALVARLQFTIIYSLWPARRSTFSIVHRDNPYDESAFSPPSSSSSRLSSPLCLSLRFFDQFETADNFTRFYSLVLPNFPSPSLSSDERVTCLDKVSRNSRFFFFFFFFSSFVLSYSR